MNNGPALVLRGAVFGCVVVCVLTALITAGWDSGQSTALAAAEAPVTTKQSTGQPKAAQAAGESSAGTEPEAKPEAETMAEQASKKNKSRKTSCSLAASYPQSILQWCQLIQQAARQHDLPADLIAALILQESGGQAQAYSKSGAVGLMQVMPRDGIAATFQCANGPCFASRPTIQELQDPAFNINYGTRFLASLVERRGSLREALFAYGPIGMGYSYADKVLAIYANHGGS